MRIKHGSLITADYMERLRQLGEWWVGKHNSAPYYLSNYKYLRIS